MLDFKCLNCNSNLEKYIRLDIKCMSSSCKYFYNTYILFSDNKILHYRFFKNKITVMSNGFYNRTLVFNGAGILDSNLIFKIDKFILVYDQLDLINVYERISKLIVFS